MMAVIVAYPLQLGRNQVPWQFKLFGLRLQILVGKERQKVAKNKLRLLHIYSYSAEKTFSKVSCHAEQTKYVGRKWGRKSNQIEQKLTAFGYTNTFAPSNPQNHLKLNFCLDSTKSTLLSFCGANISFVCYILLKLCDKTCW